MNVGLFKEYISRLEHTPTCNRTLRIGFENFLKEWEAVQVGDSEESLVLYKITTHLAIANPMEMLLDFMKQADSFPEIINAIELRICELIQNVRKDRIPDWVISWCNGKFPENLSSMVKAKFDRMVVRLLRGIKK